MAEAEAHQLDPDITHPVKTNLILTVGIQRFVIGHITFKTDGHIKEAVLNRPLDAEALGYIKHHAGHGFVFDGNSPH